MTPARMTLDEFLERLRQTPRDWELRGSYIVVNGDKEMCPITFLAGQLEVGDSTLAIRRLKLSDEDAKQIMCAADGRFNVDPALRAKLLDRCGLRDAGAGSR